MNKTFTKIALSTSTILTTALMASAVQAQSLPSGGSVAAGSATIDSAGPTITTITQTSDRAVINWASFDVAKGNRVTFIQPDVNAATLNRVTGSTDSNIAGQITAAGSVYLINPNGIQITSDGAIDVGRGFVASTLDIADSDFMAGTNLFSGTGGAVNTQGSITTGTGGFVSLLGGEVQAGGTILAPAGTVMIGTSSTATLDLNGGNFLQVALPSSAMLAGNGTVAALSADAARDAVRHMVNLPASVEATAISGSNGNVTLSGTITAAGGNVIVGATGDVALTGAQFDVSGAATGGSNVALRADAMGTSTGTVTIDGTSSITTNGAVDGGAVDIYYNPASYAVPTDYSTSVSGGTLTAWMLVNNATQLQEMDTNLSGNYALGADIDASAIATWNSGAGFAPVGDESTPYTGMFDGLGHVISGLTINRPGTDYVGLFGRASGTLRNVGLDGGAVSGYNAVGGLVGDGSGTQISNAWASGAVSGYAAVGGLVGYGAGTQISNAWASGEVSGSDTVGGLVGYGVGTRISNGWASGAVSGYAAVGGLVGFGQFATISNAYWDSYSTGQGSATGLDGSLTNVSAVTSDPAQSGAANYAFSQSAYGNFDFTSSGDWFMVDGGTRPLLRSQYSTTITTPYQLQLMMMDLDTNYTLARDIDMSETARAMNASTPGDYAGIWSPAGFVPVGDESTPYTGTFDGLGHVISGLTIDRPTTDLVGLFGKASSIIRNVGLDGGSISGDFAVGGLVGDGSGATISNAWASGAVSGTGNFVGGLVGVGAQANISNAWVSSAVSGDTVVGGLVGYGRDATISNAWASGDVSGFSIVGGLVGDGRSATISNAWASGAVSGYSAVGGLVGFGYDATISNVWASGDVSGFSIFGGLIGDGTYAQISSAYWDSYHSGQASGIGFGTPTSGAPVAVTSDPAQSGAANYAYNPAVWAGFDLDTTGGLDTVWRMYEGHTFPLLKVFMTPLTVDVSGGGVASYNGAAQSATGTYSLPTGADTALVLGTLDPVSGTNAGTYDFGIGGLYSTQLGYDLTAGTTGSLTINPAELTVTYTANSTSSIYGDAIGVLTGGLTASGLQGSDALAGVISGSAAWSTSADASSDVGSYAITGSGLSGNSGNYTYTFEQATGNATALTINARSITVAADALSRIYGDANPALTWTVGGMGLINGDTFSGSLSTGASISSDAGSYSIDQGTLDASSNYNVTFNPGMLTVTPRAMNLVYTADSASSIYGNAVTGLSGSVDAIGLVNGDTLTGTAVWTAAADATSNVGSYGVTGSGLTASSNYSLTAIQAAGNATALTIGQRALTITADNQSRLMGLPNPELTWTVGAMGLVNGDELTGELATLAGQGSLIGSYAITQGDLVASANYAVTFVDGQMSVMGLPVASPSKLVPEDFGQEGFGHSGSAQGDANGGDILNPLNLNVNFVAGSGDGATGDVGGESTSQGDGNAQVPCEFGTNSDGFPCVAEVH